eukprot:gene11981-biopygen6418
MAGAWPGRIPAGEEWRWSPSAAVHRCRGLDGRHAAARRHARARPEEEAAAPAAPPRVPAGVRCERSGRPHGSAQEFGE